MYILFGCSYVLYSCALWTLNPLQHSVDHTRWIFFSLLFFVVKIIYNFEIRCDWISQLFVVLVASSFLSLRKCHLCSSVSILSDFPFHSFQRMYERRTISSFFPIYSNIWCIFARRLIKHIYPFFDVYVWCSSVYSKRQTYRLHIHIHTQRKCDALSCCYCVRVRVRVRDVRIIGSRYSMPFEFCVVHFYPTQFHVIVQIL